MTVTSAEVTNAHVSLVLDKLKGVGGTLTLRKTYQPLTLEVSVADSGQAQQVDRTKLLQLKDEMAQWIDCHLTREQQDFLSEPGAHMRFFGKDQENAALLLSLIAQIE